MPDLQTMKQTPLHDVHAALGARMIDFGGWHMPVQYGPILDEVNIVRNACGLFDLGHMGRYHVVGPEAIAMVDSVATNYCAKIPVGSIRYSLFCLENGNPIDDVLLYREERDVFIVVNAGNRERDLEHLRKHAEAFDCEVIDESDDLDMIALQGQTSVAIMQAVTEGCDVSAIKYYKFDFGTVCGIENVRISRTGYTGEDGFEIYFPPTESERVWSALLEVGNEHGLQPIGLGARDTLRLEAGMALYGHEIDDNHNPVEAGLGFGISFKEEKGDYLGREALLAIKASPKQALIGITTDGKRVPRQGYKLFRGDTEVGYVVSGSVSPTIKTNIGTAYVLLGNEEVGTALEMDIRGKRQACVVAPQPFFSRTRK
jgi:aminomethyltransferase